MITDELKTTDVRIWENRCFTTDRLHNAFPAITQCVIYDTATVHLLYGKICMRWVSRMLTKQHKQKYMVALRIFFFRALPQRRDKFLEHIVTGDETWVSNYKHESNQQKSPGCNDIKCWVIKVHIREPQMWLFKFLNHCWKYRHVLEEWNVAKHVPYLGREITQKLKITMA